MSGKEDAPEIVVDNDVAVPMSDGVALRANVLRTAGTGRYPGLLMRTPYGKPNGGFQRVVRSGYASKSQAVIFRTTTGITTRAGTTWRKRNSWRRYRRSIIPGSVLRGWSCLFFPERATGYAAKGCVRVR